MAANLTTIKSGYSPDRTVIAGIGLMFFAVAIALVAWMVVDGTFAGYPYLFVLPWALALGVVLIVPTVVLYYRGKLTFTDPLVFATWSYFFPAFVVGAILFAVGLHDPYYLVFIHDLDFTLPYTLGLIALGFAGLALGYFLPLSSQIGAAIGNRLPTVDHTESSLAFPGTLLLLLGVFNTIMAFLQGLFGYQRTDEISSYDGLLQLIPFFWTQASFLLWLIIFRLKTVTFLYAPVIALLVVTSVTKIVFSGSRGMILQIFFIVALAYIFSGRQFRLKQAVGSGIVLTILMMGGMIYGTTFRNIKSTESVEGTGQYVDNILLTFDQLGTNDSIESLTFGFSSLAGRIEVVTTLAVVVSNYEQLAPYEEAYGLDDNIWTDLTTFLIPRVVWPEKPYASDPRKYGDLYFDYGESSFVITPMGDLLRNYGVPGVFVGLFVLGIILRVLYRALVAEQPFAIWRVTLYFALLTTISYEGFYGTIIPNMFKVGFFAIIGIIFVGLLANRVKPVRPVNSPITT